MKFEKPESFFQEKSREETPIEKIQREKERQIEKLENFLKKISDEYKELGIPVRSDCRIEMNNFEKIYPKEIIERDKENVRQLQEKWRKEAPVEKKDKERVGELLEMLAVGIFYKFLKDRFIILRSSSFDDVYNKVDTLIIDKETGNVVCAFDEVADVLRTRYHEKRENVMRINKKGGARLKYGLELKEVKKGNQELEVKFSSLKNLPIFYIALPEGVVFNGIKNFNSHLENLSNEEKIIFLYFIDRIKNQIKELKERKLNRKLWERINTFEESLNKIEKEKAFLFSLPREVAKKRRKK